MAAAEEPNVIEIPLWESPDETVELDLNDLPEDSEMVQDIMLQERAALNFWHTIAKQYYKQGNHEAFRNILEAAVAYADSAPFDDERLKTHKDDHLEVLTALAAYYSKLAEQSTSNEQKKGHMKRAQDLYIALDHLGLYVDNSLLGKAFFYLMQAGKMDQARLQLDIILSSDISNIPATLGKACILFAEQNYAQALQSYTQVLKSNPDCPAGVRVGMGMCFARLDHPDRAEEAFERALELEPRNEYALVALALLSFNSKAPNSVKKGVQMLTRAYSANPKNAMVLNHLANHFFFKKQYEKARNLALHALETCAVKSMQAESFYHLARSHHAEENYDSAFPNYYQATKLAPKFVLPHYGLGQMHIQKGDLAKACESFETVLKLAPDNTDALKILGSLYGNSKSESKRAKARLFLEKVTEQRAEDVEAWVELASLTEASDPEKALEAYEKAIGLISTLGAALPPELENNVGCLRRKLGRLEAAQSAFTSALSSCQASLDGQDGEDGVELSETDRAYYEGITVTIRYNYARLLEQMSHSEEACDAYRQILQEHPNYIDCYLRIGCIMRDKGLIRNASDMYQEAFLVDRNQPDAWILLADLHMRKKEWQPAQKKLESVVMSPEAKHDPYAVCAMANIFLQTARPEEPERFRKSLDRATDLFSGALRKDPANMFAAHGIGCVFALKGKLAPANEVFSKVREASSRLGGRSAVDPWLNLAHICVSQRQYDKAIKFYENVLKKFLHNCDHDVLTYLARAYFKAKKYREARRAAQRALHLNPVNASLRFNFALTQQRFATSELERTTHTVADVEGAIDMLRGSRTIFQDLKTRTQDRKFDAKLAAKEAKRCDDHLQQAGMFLERAAEQDETRKQKLEHKTAEHVALKERLRLRKEEKEASLRGVEEAKRKRYQEHLAKVQEAKMTEFAALPKPAKKSRKRKKEDDGFIASESEEESDLSPLGSGEEEDRDLVKQRQEKRRKKAARKEKKAQKKRKRKIKRDSGSDSDSDDGDLKATVSARKGKNSFKSNQFVESEDSDDDGLVAAADPSAGDDAAPASQAEPNAAPAAPEASDAPPMDTGE